jgi:hypothetical protein
MAAVTTKPLSWWQQRKHEKQKNETEYRGRMTALLRYTTLGYHSYSAAIKFIMLFPPCVIISTLVVKGGYDWLFETGFPLVALAAFYLALGISLPTWRIRRAKLRGYETSVRTWVLIGIILVSLGALCLYGAIMYQGLLTTNVGWWHHYASNKPKRDAFGRTGPEGLYTGLFMAYMTWNPVKYDMKGTWADRFFKIVRWPSSLESDHKRPIRWWHVFVCPLIMALPMAGALIAGWDLHILVDAHSVAIHNWIRGAVPWQYHSTIPAKFEYWGAKIGNLFLESWWIWLSGYIGGKVFARLPAKGLINLLQEDAAQSRIVKFGGDIRKAQSAWRSLGFNVHVAIEFYEGIAKFFGMFQDEPEVAESNDKRLGMTAEQIKVLDLMITDENRAKAYAAAATFSRKEVKERDPGVLIPLKALGWSAPVLMLVSIWIIYLHPHLHAVEHLLHLN